MASTSDRSVRLAGADDADAVGRLLHDFNTEYGDVTPGPAALAVRIRELIGSGETVVLLGGAGPDGVAVLRFRRSIFTPGLEAHLQELYVIPGRRGHGLGRALMDGVLSTAREQGADYIELGTSEDDVAARALYESLGFRNREQGPDGPISYFYELEL